jgi:hypothetical protein
MSARRRDAGCACGSSSRAHAQQSGISKEGSLSTHTRLIIDVIPALSLHVPHSRSTTALSRATAQQRHAQINDICAPGSTIQQCMCSLEHNPQRLVVLPKAQSSAVLVIMCSRRASTCSASSLSQVCWLRCRPAPLPLQIAHVALLARVMCNGLPSLSPCPTPGRTRCLKNCLQDPGRHAHGESRWYSSSSMHVYRGPRL